MNDVHTLICCSFGNLWVAMTWRCMSSCKFHCGARSNSPRFVTPIPQLKSSILRPSSKVTYEPSPFAMTASMRRPRPLVTCCCPKATRESAEVDIARNLALLPAETTRSQDRAWSFLRWRRSVTQSNYRSMKCLPNHWRYRTFGDARTACWTDGPCACRCSVKKRHFWYP
jgi:hypothetical protein